MISRLRPHLALFAVAALALGACGGGDEKETAAPEKPAPSDTVEPTTTTARTVAPLTGLPVDDPSAITREAVVVKIDNAPQARPQAGLDEADLVHEERVEGGVVRFLAVFHQFDADMIGPIRSVRSSDPPIIWPLGGVFAFSDGTPPFVAAAKELPATVLYEAAHGDAFELRSGRNRPWKTFSSTKRLRAKSANHTAPPALFSFLDDGETFGAGGAPATSVNVVIGERTTAGWEYDPSTKKYLRITNGTAHTVESGARVASDNVILQSVQYKGTGYTDSSRAAVDEAVVVGSGDATVLAGGKVVKAKWSKPTKDAVTTFTDVSGAPLELRPGRTWISLIPTGAPVTIR